MKELIKAGKFIVIKDRIVESYCCGIAEMSDKSAYGIFTIHNNPVDNSTEFKVLLDHHSMEFVCRMWYTSDIVSAMKNDSNIQIFDSLEDAECYLYVLTHTNPTPKVSWINKFWKQIKIYREIYKENK